MRCALTGSSGQLGRRCALALAAAGHPVQRWTRRPDAPGDVRFALGAPVDPAPLRDVDALIHCAHDFSRRDARGDRAVNVAGGLALLDACARAGVRAVVFVSSVAAFDGCRTVYGRGKREVERAALSLGARAARPGLLWSERPAGPFRALCRLAALPWIPLLDDGAQPIALAHVDDVAAALVRCVERFDAVPEAPFTLAQPERPTVREVLEDLASSRGRAPRFVSMPSRLALDAAAWAERWSPVSADPLRTILWPSPTHDPAPAALGVSARSFGRRAASGGC